MVHDISFPAGMELQNALKLIFDQTHDPAELTYEIRNEVMVITTVVKAMSEDALVTRVYEVDELLDLEYDDGLIFPAHAGVTNRGGGFMSVPQESSGVEKQNQQAPAQSPPHTDLPATVVKLNLAVIVAEMTSPPAKWFQIDGEGGTVRIVGRNLVVRQTPAIHREIVRLLNLLSESLSKTQ